MSASSVVIKGTKSGIILVLDSTMDFESLKVQIADKFRQSSSFLGNASIALSFEGRKLTDEEQRQILDIIHDNSQLNVVCVVETDPVKGKMLERSLEERLMELSKNTGQFYKGTLRSGQVLEFETSVIILGDVNPGAKIVSKGNIIVLGALKGNAYAGVAGNSDAFILALDMSPVNIQIADLYARPSEDDMPAKNQPKEPKIVYVEDGNIYIEPFSRNVMKDIHYFK